jgi:ornithine decarboxylase
VSLDLTSLRATAADDFLKSRLDAILDAISVSDLETRLVGGPVYAFHPGATAQAARIFLDHFPGTTLYAAKANDLPEILTELYAAGIENFDVASLAEIEKITRACPGAVCHFMNPVKPLEAMTAAYKDHGVRTFAVDSFPELRKVQRAVGRDSSVRIAIRLAVPDDSAAVSIGGKFGVQVGEASELLRFAADFGYRPGVTFHVGGQCESMQAYAKALGLVGTAAERARVALSLVDVGGGFPGGYVDQKHMLPEYFSVIRHALSFVPLAVGADVFCEPGRALIADSITVVARVELCRGQDIFINDGVYGALSELPLLGSRIPVALARDGRLMDGARGDYRLMGPTCNNIDVMTGPFSLPNAIAEGDWLLLGQLGPYSTAIRTHFNGFYSDQFVFTPMKSHRPNATFVQ